jgi:hypothetical protein
MACEISLSFAHPQQALALLTQVERPYSLGLGSLWSGAATVPRADRGGSPFPTTARNLAIASTRVAAAPFVTPGVPGTMVMIDHRHRNSGGPKRESLGL